MMQQSGFTTHNLKPTKVYKHRTGQSHGRGFAEMKVGEPPGVKSFVVLLHENGLLVHKIRNNRQLQILVGHIRRLYSCDSESGYDAYAFVEVCKAFRPTARILEPYAMDEDSSYVTVVRIATLHLQPSISVCESTARFLIWGIH